MLQQMTTTNIGEGTVITTTPMTTAATTCLTTRTIKQEPLDTEMTTVTFTHSTSQQQQQQTLVKPTIILATQSLQHGSHIKQERLVLPKMNIKVEPADSYSVTSSPEHISKFCL